MTAFLDDVREQSQALEAALTRPLGGIRGLVSRVDRVVLTGMGASLAASYPAYVRLLRSAMPVTLVEAGELLHYGQMELGPRALLVAASQSGRSAEIEALLDEARACIVVGVTNDASSPLATKADLTVELQAGQERTGVSTKTYIAMVAVLTRVAELVVGGSDPSRPLLGAVSPLEQFVARADRHVEWWARAVGLPDQLFVLGRGPSLGAVHDGALTIKEAARVAAEGMSVAQFRHGPIELIGPHLTAIVVEGQKPTAEMNTAFARELMRRGAQTIWCGRPRGGLSCAPSVEVEDAARPIVEHVPLQLLALHLSELTGTEPGAFRHATKVTAVQ